MKKFTAITCRKAARLGIKPPRHYGYTLRIQPPNVFTTDGQDVEGIGWCPHPTRTHTHHWQGWYKYKRDAVRRAEELNKSN